MTADLIRAKILETVSENGGHLASSLGAVEIAMALAEVFDPASDRIVWDVGHQAYAWKILTGRGGSFSTLRRFGGISGFPSPAESPCDTAVAGHAGVAISVAEGYAADHLIQLIIAEFKLLIFIHGMPPCLIGSTEETLTRFHLRR